MATMEQAETVAAAEIAAYQRALEDVRRSAAERSMHYRSEARRFGDSGQYGTAETMRCCAEAYGIVCLDIGRRLGIDNQAALRVESPGAGSPSDA